MKPGDRNRLDLFAAFRVLLGISVMRSASCEDLSIVYDTCMQLDDSDLLVLTPDHDEFLAVVARGAFGESIVFTDHLRLVAADLADRLDVL